MTADSTRSPSVDDLVSRLDRVVRILTGRSATPDEVGRFRRYVELLVLWNRSYRLTGVRSAREIVEHLIQDSLLFLTWIPALPIKVVDLGSGAGVPGIPLQVVRPDLSLTLIEARRKPVSFLSTVKRELQLEGIEVLEGRAEDLARTRSDLRGAFDVVVSRAVGTPGTLLPVSMQFLKPGGMFVSGGPPQATRTITLRPGISAKAEVVSFPELGISRNFVVAVKQPLKAEDEAQ
ncbi:MAG: 16S rRNA (guanine(527)-N(7))-methyltransferase RsmG [Candidatus Rokuibacteriota bacterium]|nr:MAG: 16S rRNA (guanine(527)-N(7))-methyltransferase RsmG [Candidatus Rokubacteria bacterium]